MNHICTPALPTKIKSQSKPLCGPCCVNHPNCFRLVCCLGLRSDAAAFQRTTGPYPTISPGDLPLHLAENTSPVPPTGGWTTASTVGDRYISRTRSIDTSAMTTQRTRSLPVRGESVFAGSSWPGVGCFLFFCHCSVDSFCESAPKTPASLQRVARRY